MLFASTANGLVRKLSAVRGRGPSGAAYVSRISCFNGSPSKKILRLRSNPSPAIQVALCLILLVSCREAVAQTVSLQQLVATSPRGVLLIFYRGYW